MSASLYLKISIRLDPGISGIELRQSYFLHPCPMGNSHASNSPRRRRRRRNIAGWNFEEAGVMAVEVFRTMEPWTSANEDASAEPFGTVEAIRRAVIRRVIVITIRARRRHANTDLGRTTGRSRDAETSCSRGQSKIFQTAHRITSPTLEKRVMQGSCAEISFTARQSDGLKASNYLSIHNPLSDATECQEFYL